MLLNRSRYQPLITALFFLIMLTACHDEEPVQKDPKTTADECITSSTDRHGDIIPGEYIVSFTSDRTSRSARKRIFESYRITDEKILGTTEGALDHYFLKLTAQEAEALKHGGEVASIEPDRVISLCACFTVEEPRLITWNVNQVGYGDGTGKTAWILDTGIEFSHPDLVVNKEKSKSFVDNVVNANDDNGHGTHIAGIIGAKNNRVGTLGVAAGATVIALKILDSKGDGKLSYALKALNHVRAYGNAGNVINISMSLDDVSEIIETEIRAVADRGIYVTIAAGNESRMANLASPARTSGKNIFTVSAVDSLKRFASFSNFGNDVVDFAAPGVRIPSSYLNGKYAYMSGTSMAAPHVAGIILVNSGLINTDGYALDDPDETPDPLAHR